MRITRIALSTFRSHVRTAIDLADRITFLCGPNGAGKSTVIDGLQFALLGTCRGTDARGVGSADLVHTPSHGVPAGKAIAAVDVAGVGTVARQVEGRSVALTVGEERGALGTQQARLLAALGGAPAAPPVPAGALAAVLGGDLLVDLPHAEAKALLLAVLDVRIPFEGATLTLEQLDARHAKAFEDRRGAKARLQAIAVPAEPGELEPDLADVERRLGELRTREKLLIGEGARADGQARAERRALEDEAERHRAKIGVLERELDAIAAALVAGHVDADLARACELAAALNEHDAQGQADAESDIAAREASRVLELLTKHEPAAGCVLNAGVPCKTPVKAFRARAGELEATIAELRARIEAQAARATRAAEHRAELAAIRRRLEAERKLEAKRADVIAELEDRRTKLTAALEALERMPAAPPVAGELAQVHERIAQGEAVLEQARALVLAWAAHRARTKDKQAAAVEVARLERLVDELGPKGIRVEALASVLEAFTGTTNGVLAWWGYRLRFMLDPWRIVVNGRGADLLSSSERFRVGVALQLAIAEAAGLGFVAIDGADVLDQANRAILAELLDDWPGQVLVAATADGPPAIDAPGVAVYWLTREHEQTVARLAVHLEGPHAAAHVEGRVPIATAGPVDITEGLEPMEDR